MQHKSLAKRFRGFLPVIIDVETGGFHPEKDALLEIAAVPVFMDEQGLIHPDQTIACNVLPFEGSHMDSQALEFNKIKDPYHPFRNAKPEKEALEYLFSSVKEAMKRTKCKRAVLVGHNANFDLSFLLAATQRCQLKSPFHSFTTFDTATLSGLAFGETVLAQALKAADIEFNPNEAHSAIYDAEKTAELFCKIVNKWFMLHQ